MTKLIVNFALFCRKGSHLQIRNSASDDTGIYYCKAVSPLTAVLSNPCAVNINTGVLSVITVVTRQVFWQTGVNHFLGDCCGFCMCLIFLHVLCPHSQVIIWSHYRAPIASSQSVGVIGDMWLCTLSMVNKMTWIWRHGNHSSCLLSPMCTDNRSLEMLSFSWPDAVFRQQISCCWSCKSRIQQRCPV